MTDAEKQNLSLVRNYLAALESRQSGAALAQFFSPDVIQEE